MKDGLKILFLLFLLVLILNLLSSRVRDFFFLIVSPVEKFLWQTSNRTLTHLKFFSRYREMEKNLDSLERERLKLLQENLSLKEIKRENEFLKKALGLKEESKREFLFARVFQKDLFSDSILVDKGSLDGVNKGDYAFLPENIFLGRVKEVYDHFCRLSLVTARGFELDVKISEKEIFGKGVGKGGQRMVAEFLEGKEKIEVGDKILTGGLSFSLPENLLVGEISKKIQRESSPYLEAEIKPYFSLSDLNLVLISRK